jgi:hypothetical protein
LARVLGRSEGLRGGRLCQNAADTDDATRGLIEFNDASATRWPTVGVSGNIIDASLQALVYVINFKLVKAGATA